MQGPNLSPWRPNSTKKLQEQLCYRLGKKGRVEQRSARGSAYGGCASAALELQRCARAQTLTASLDRAWYQSRGYILKLLQTASEWRSVLFPNSTSIKSSSTHTMQPFLSSGIPRITTRPAQAGIFSSLAQPAVPGPGDTAGRPSLASRICPVRGDAAACRAARQIEGIAACSRAGPGHSNGRPPSTGVGPTG